MSDVIWVDTTRMHFDNSARHKLTRLIESSGATADLSEGMRVALKVNTAEEGYDYGLRPEFVRTVAEAANAATQTRPVVCDGLKLIDYWKQARGNNFMKLTSSQGFSSETLGGHFVINGGFSGDEGDCFPATCPIPNWAGWKWARRFAAAMPSGCSRTSPCTHWWG
jgi:uncharacterized Fe-S center protein